jgi:hypothetical protein
MDIDKFILPYFFGNPDWDCEMEVKEGKNDYDIDINFTFIKRTPIKTIECTIIIE